MRLLNMFTEHVYRIYTECVYRSRSLNTFTDFVSRTRLLIAFILLRLLNALKVSLLIACKTVLHFVWYGAPYIIVKTECYNLFGEKWVKKLIPLELKSHCLHVDVSCLPTMITAWHVVTHMTPQKHTTSNCIMRLLTTQSTI